MNLILDPSVVIKWYIPEVLSTDAIALKEWISNEGILIAVPEFFFVEAANVIWKKTSVTNEISHSYAKTIFSEIMDIPFQIIFNRQVLTSAYEMASSFTITVYDAIYIASAYRFQAKFVTADIVLTRRLAATGLSSLIVPLPNWKSKI